MLLSVLFNSNSRSLHLQVTYYIKLKCPSGSIAVFVTENRDEEKLKQKDHLSTAKM